MKVQHEPQALSLETMSALQSMGHRLKNLQRSYGNMHVIVQDRSTNELSVASDLRGIGKAQTGRR